MASREIAFSSVVFCMIWFLWRLLRTPYEPHQRLKRIELPIHGALAVSTCPVARTGRARREGVNLRLHGAIPVEVRHERAHVRKRTHGFHRPGLAVRLLVQAVHAHELGEPIVLCRARAALAR